MPRHSVNLNVDCETRLESWRRLRLGAGLSGQSSQFLLGDESNQAAPVQGFVVADLRASIEALPQVFVFGEVLLAEAPDASNPRFLGPGAPRRWTIGMRTSF